MKVALVTGGTRGIGFSIIKLLALEENLKVITCGTKPTSEVKLPVGVEYIQCDISSSSSATMMTRKIIDTHYKIDIVINNNAGISHVFPTASLPRITAHQNLM